MSIYITCCQIVSFCFLRALLFLGAGKSWFLLIGVFTGATFLFVRF